MDNFTNILELDLLDSKLTFKVHMKNKCWDVFVVNKCDILIDSGLCSVNLHCLWANQAS